jgi:sugar phosphate isomerase/epimerase
MQYGAMNNPLNSLAEEVQRVASLGVDYLELCMDAPFAHHTIIRETLPFIRRTLAAAGMSLVGHLPTFVYTADLTASIRTASLAEILASLEVASELAVPKAVLHPSAVHPLGSAIMELSLQYAAETLSTVVHRANQLGIVLCLENMFPRYRAFFEPVAFVDIFRQYSELMLTLDIAHAHIGCRDGARALEFIQRFGKRIGHIHVSDNRLKQDDHLPLGAGSIDLQGIVSALKQSGYDGTVTLEIFDENPASVVESMQKWKNTWELKSPEQSRKRPGLGNTL